MSENGIVFHEHEHDGLGALAFPDGGAHDPRLGHQSVGVPLLDLLDPFEGGFALALREQSAGKGQHTKGNQSPPQAVGRIFVLTRSIPFSVDSRRHINLFG